MAVTLVSATAITGVKGVTTVTSGAITVLAGDIAVVCGLGANATLTSIVCTDSQSNAYTNFQQNLSSNGRGVLSYATMASSGSPTFTITVNASSSIVGIVYILRGGTLTGAVTSTLATASATATPSIVSGTANVGDAIIAFVGANGPAGDTFTDDVDTLNGSWAASTVSGTTSGAVATNATAHAQSKIQTTASSTQTHNPTLGTARLWMDAIIVVPAAVAAGTAPKRPVIVGNSAAIIRANNW